MSDYPERENSPMSHTEIAVRFLNNLKIHDKNFCAIRNSTRNLKDWGRTSEQKFGITVKITEDDVSIISTGADGRWTGLQVSRGKELDDIKTHDPGENADWTLVEELRDIARVKKQVAINSAAHWDKNLPKLNPERFLTEAQLSLLNIQARILSTLKSMQ